MSIGVRFFVVFTVILTCTSLSTAQENVQVEVQSQKIFGSVMSPFCPGRLLNDCPSPQATELKDQIRTKLAAGENSDQIVTGLIQTYGQSVLAAPRFSGFGMFSWLGPIIFIVLGCFLLFGWIIRMQRSKDSTEESPAPIPDEIAKRIHREM